MLSFDRVELFVTTKSAKAFSNTRMALNSLFVGCLVTGTIAIMVCAFASSHLQNFIITARRSRARSRILQAFGWKYPFPLVPFFCSGSCGAIWFLTYFQFDEATRRSAHTLGRMLLAGMVNGTYTIAFLLPLSFAAFTSFQANMLTLIGFRLAFWFVDAASEGFPLTSRLDVAGSSRISSSTAACRQSFRCCSSRSDRVFAVPQLTLAVRCVAAVRVYDQCGVP